MLRNRMFCLPLDEHLKDTHSNNFRKRPTDRTLLHYLRSYVCSTMKMQIDFSLNIFRLLHPSWCFFKLFLYLMRGYLELFFIFAKALFSCDYELLMIY